MFVFLLLIALGFVALLIAGLARLARREGGLMRVSWQSDAGDALKVGYRHHRPESERV